MKSLYFPSRLTALALLAVLLTSIGDAWAQRSRWDRDRSGDRTWRGASGNNERERGANPTGDAYRDQYGVIAEQNIFLKDRRPRRTEPRNMGPRIPSRPEASMVLTGVVFENSAFTAYIEDVRSGNVLKLHNGDNVASGRIVEIQIDAIAYLSESGIAWIEIGNNLTGSSVESVSSARISAALNASSGSGQAAGGVAPPPLDPNTANLSMEERLRLRRLQEVNPGAAISAPPGAEPQPGADRDQFNEREDGDDQPQGQAGFAPQEVAPAEVQGVPAGNLSIEEQLRLRRMQELNQAPQEGSGQ